MSSIRSAISVEASSRMDVPVVGGQAPPSPWVPSAPAPTTGSPSRFHATMTIDVLQAPPDSQFREVCENNKQSRWRAMVGTTNLGKHDDIDGWLSSPLCAVTSCAARIDQRPKSRARGFEGRASRAVRISASVCSPPHHWDSGIVAFTWAMCWPHPAHVVFPQTLQVTALHMMLLLVLVLLVLSSRRAPVQGDVHNDHHIPWGV